MSDALSSNITSLLEALLQDYDKTERPAFNTGEATQVKINVLIRSMGPISEEDMVYDTTWILLWVHFRIFPLRIISELLHGLLLPPVLARRKAELYWDEEERTLTLN